MGTKLFRCRSLMLRLTCDRQTNWQGWAAGTLFDDIFTTVCWRRSIGRNNFDLARPASPFSFFKTVDLFILLHSPCDDDIGTSSWDVQSEFRKIWNKRDFLWELLCQREDTTQKFANKLGGVLNFRDYSRKMQPIGKNNELDWFRIFPRKKRDGDVQLFLIWARTPNQEASQGRLAQLYDKSC